VYGNLFFAAASNFEAQLPQIEPSSGPAAVVLSLRGQDEIGSTFIGVLQRYQQTLTDGGGALFLAGVDPHVKHQLARTGIDSQIGEARIFLTKPQLGASMNLAIATARQWLDRASHVEGVNNK
jgi:SulP family sulfate permease